MALELDPLYWQVARWLLAGVFASALAHKLRSPAAFAGIVRAYELVPPALALPTAGLLMVLEAAVVAGLASGIAVPWFAALATALLAAYGGAMAINLARGRRDLDCGCFGPAAGAGRRGLSPWLLLRNLVLIGVAALLFLPAAWRDLAWLDLSVVAMATMAGLALLAATDQLVANLPKLRGAAR